MSAKDFESVGELAANVGDFAGPVSPAIKATKFAWRFVQGPEVTRLLKALAKDFKDEVGYATDRFWAWQTNEPLTEALVAIVGGIAVGDDASLAELTALIEPRLTETPEDQRPALAAKIAEAAFAKVADVLHDDEKLSFLVRAIQQQAASAAKDRRDRQAAEATLQRTADVIRDAVTAEQPTDTAMALVRGPLEHAGVDEIARRAEALLADGRPAEAADALLEVAARLAEHTPPLADAFLVRAADALMAAGQEVRATDALVDATWARLDRGQPHSAWSLLSALDRACGTRAPWLAAAVIVEVDWPERGGLIGDILAEAINATDRPDRRARWTATLATVATVHGDLEVAADLPGVPAPDVRDGGPAAVAAALSASAASRLGRPEAETAWSAIERWAETVADPMQAATAWAQRGAALALCGRRDDAVAAYRRAMRLWSESPGAEEQAAAMYLCSKAVDMLHARRPEDDDARPLAVALRSTRTLPTNVADRLTHAGIAEMVENRWPDALRSLCHAYGVAVRCGDVSAATDVERKLARLFASTGRPAQAAEMAIRCGDGKQARALARDIEARHLEDLLSPSMAPWQRAAQWALLALTGARVSEGWVAAHGRAVMADEPEPTSWWGPTPAGFAADAVAAMLAVTPDPLFLEAVDIVRGRLAHPYIPGRKHAARALIELTHTGRVDETEALVDLALGPDYQHEVDADWLWDRIKDRDPLRGRVEAAAIDGSWPALEVLAHAEHLGDEASLAADRATLAAAGITTRRTIKEEDGSTTESAEMVASLREDGIVARHASPEARAALLARLLDLVEDADDMAANRAQAADAIYNMASALTEEQRAHAAERVMPLAAGRTGRSRWDGGRDDPLSRFRIGVPDAEHVQASCLHLVGRLHHLGAGDASDPSGAALVALGSPHALVTATALDALCWVERPQVPAGLTLWLGHADAQVRLAALRLWTHEQPAGPLSDEAADLLAADVHAIVRHAAVDLASERGDLPLLRRLADDAHVLVRGLARDRLRVAEADDAASAA